MSYRFCFPIGRNRQLNNKIHGEVFSFVHWYEERMQVIIEFILYSFKNQTNVAAFHLGLNIGSEYWLVVFSEYHFSSFFIPNVLLADCCNINWSTFYKWLLGRKKGLSGTLAHQSLPNYLLGLIYKSCKPFNFSSTDLIATILSH